MVITATEFKTNLGKYLKLSQDTDVYITKNGKMIAKISNPNIKAVDYLSGLLKDKLDESYDASDIKKERLEKYENID